MAAISAADSLFAIRFLYYIQEPSCIFQALICYTEFIVVFFAGNTLNGEMQSTEKMLESLCASGIWLSIVSNRG